MPETVAQVPTFCAEQFGAAPAQRFKRDGQWQDLSHAEVAEIAGEIARGLVALGVQAGDRVAVLAETRAEWTQVQYGVALAGAVTVPIYPSSSPDECHWVLSDSGAVAVVCEDAGQVAKIGQIRDQVPGLKHVVVLDPDGAEQSLAELRALGRDGDRTVTGDRAAAVRPEDPSLIIYTSGTTGRPKGCVLSHRNLTAPCAITHEMGLIGEGDVQYLFLPLAHVFAQVMQFAIAATGGVTAYCSDGAKAIMPDCQEVRPTVLPSVPRIFEKVYSVFAGADRNDPEVQARARGAFGGRISVAISGAAPIGVEILEFFHTAGVPVYEGYGLSESTATGTLNAPGATRLGSIGRPVPGCEARIADDGEILLRGPVVFDGYWNNPDATAETLTEDGWLRTGDLGSIDDDGFVTITGRKKDIIITAGGKNITPANLENDLRQSPFVSQAVMYGDRRPYPVVLLTLDPEKIVPWARERGLPEDLPTLSQHPDVHAMLQSLLDDVNGRYAKVAQAKKFAVLGHDFSLETGELTPTLKVKRPVVASMYAPVFDALYA